MGWIKGPNIFKRNGYYYLITAEGGPHYEYAVTLWRSKSIWGPYELHPNKYILTSKDSNVKLQKSGHALICSNDYACGFTGTMIVLACQDIFMHENYADFKFFEYKDIKC